MGQVCEKGSERRTDGFAADDLAKDDVLSVKVSRSGTRDEELGAISIWASVGLSGSGSERRVCK